MSYGDHDSLCLIKLCRTNICINFIYCIFIVFIVVILVYLLYYLFQMSSECDGQRREAACATWWASVGVGVGVAAGVGWLVGGPG